LRLDTCDVSEPGVRRLAGAPAFSELRALTFCEPVPEAALAGLLASANLARLDSLFRCLQVLVHDGGPRLTDRRPELVWVRVTGGEGDVFTGTVLNQPHQLVPGARGSAIRFLVPAGGEHPLLVTEKYLRERPDWEVAIPCNRCGLTELLDAPSDLLRVVFPNLPRDAVMSSFTAFCGVCGGTLVVSHKGAGGEAPAAGPPPPKKWWQFWK